jgi:hypothetical protein
MRDMVDRMIEDKFAPGKRLKTMSHRRLFWITLAFLWVPVLQDSASSSSFARDGNDQLESASFASGESLNFSYDSSYGQLTAISDAQESGFSLSFQSDVLLHLPLSQTVRDEASGDTLLSTSIAYDAQGMRASRTVSAGSEGQGSSTSSYWYGGGLHPLVVTRDGADYRLIGKGVVEAVVVSGPTRSYLQADHLGSIRMVTDDEGQVVQSLSYDDYGLTRISRQSASAGDASMASFYRFQGQEQETFPLAQLSIDNGALAAWLDQLQLYHFPWRDYAAGLAAFTQTDPIPTEDSLYAALGANPVNNTDETGGMLGELANIDPEVQGLFDLIAGNPNTSLSGAQLDQLGKTISRVITENTTQLHEEFDDQASMLLFEVRKLKTAREELAEARAEERIGRLNFKTSMRYLSITLAQTKRQLNEFHDWASNYDSRRREWLHKYTRVLAKYYQFNREDDDDKNDEKNAAAGDPRPLEESSSVSESDGEARPLLGDENSDDDVVHDLTIGGRQNVPPTRPEFNERSQDVSPRPDDSHRIRCCNIL